MREIISTLPLTLQFNRNLKPEDWKDMDQVLQLHQLTKDLFQWSMNNKRFNLESHWAELGESCQKICLKEIDFKDLMIITKGWNTTRKFRLLKVRENIIRENQATIQAIEEQLTQTGNTQIPSGLQGEAKSALQWLPTIQKPTGQLPRVIILHTPRKFPGEDKDTRAKRRPLFPKGRESQTQQSRDCWTW
ncbi:hypothetical protein O181_110254 [Austropuccinia psidii MF-1]|uniref:Uncharacterized protein n=1 Tax=Austropuccinia psidii MF-1 TaxID=1389203 RepID=A0A9Q3JXZ4_9BASI|nr:hypothetical protein [Austropuccinia psidii MF-1]